MSQDFLETIGCDLRL